MGHKGPEMYHDDTAEGFDNLGRLAEDLKNETWREEGACWGSQLEDFFPKRGESTRRAKAICGSCAVKAACAEFATFNTPTSDANDGIWGELTRTERQQVRRESGNEETAEQHRRKAS